MIYFNLFAFRKGRRGIQLYRENFFNKGHMFTYFNYDEHDEIKKYLSENFSNCRITRHSIGDFNEELYLNFDEIADELHFLWLASSGIEIPE